MSAASAMQRRGRAGRVRPGTCYKMFSRRQASTLEVRHTTAALQENICPQFLYAHHNGRQSPGTMQAPSAANDTSKPCYPALEQQMYHCGMRCDLRRLNKQQRCYACHWSRCASPSRCACRTARPFSRL